MATINEASVVPGSETKKGGKVGSSMPLLGYFKKKLNSIEDSGISSTSRIDRRIQTRPVDDRRFVYFDA